MRPVSPIFGGGRNAAFTVRLKRVFYGVPRNCDTSGALNGWSVRTPYPSNSQTGTAVSAGGYRLARMGPGFGTEIPWVGREFSAGEGRAGQAQAPALIRNSGGLG